MKNAALIAAILTLFAGCVNEYGRFRPPDPLGRALFDLIDRPPKDRINTGTAYEGAEYVVTSDMPRAKYESIPMNRNSNEDWISGYWRWNGDRWLWTPGHYERRPHANAVWVPSQYYTANGQRYWRTGYWR